MSTEQISENNANTLKIMSKTQQDIILMNQARAIVAKNASTPEVANSFISKIRLKIKQATHLKNQSSKPSISTLREIARKKRMANNICEAV